MKNTEAATLQKLLKLVTSDNKFRIIQLLTEGEICVCDIGEKLDMEQSLVSHHLNDLRRSGLVNDRKLGTWVHCSLNKSEFERIFKLYTKYLSPEMISDKMCSIHEACHCVVEEVDF